MAQGGGPGGGAGTDPDAGSPEAATFVVSPIPGVGDYLTIQAAVDNLPAEGGYILVRESTYNENVILSNKPIQIRGCGRGATTIDLGAVDGAAFTAASANKYVIRDLSVIGNPANIQQFLDLGAAADVLVENVETTDILRIVETTSAADVTFNDCSLNMPAAANATWWVNFFGTAGKLTWVDVESVVPTPSTSLISGQPDFTVVDSYSGGPPTISSCDVGRLLLQGFEYDHIAFTTHQPNSRVANVVGSDVQFIMAAPGLSIIGSDFVSTVETSPLIELSGLSGAIRLRVSNVTFDGGGIQQFMSIAAGDASAITFVFVSSCSLANGVTAFMDLTTVTMSLTDNQFDGSVPSMVGTNITLIGSPTYGFTATGALAAGDLLTIAGKGQPVTKITGDVETASAGSNLTVDLLLVTRSTGATVTNLGTLTIVAGALTGTVFLTTPADVLDTQALKATVTDPGSGTPAQNLVMLAS